jgi:dihydrofolate reductase
MRIALVAAVAENGVIGAEGGMPWHYPADLAQFRETTMGHPVIVGRRTYEAIAERLGGPLPGRTNVVLSRRADLELPAGAVVAGGVEAALEAAEAALEPGTETVYVAGGGAVYEQFVERADELVEYVPEYDAAPVLADPPAILVPAVPSCPSCRRGCSSSPRES